MASSGPRTDIHGNDERPVQTVLSALPKAVKLFFAVDLLLLTIAIACEIICRKVLHLGFPYNSPLLYEYFPDIVTLRERFVLFHTLRFFTAANLAPFMYPAPVAVLYRFFYLFEPYDLVVFLSFAVVSFVVPSAAFCKALIERGISRRNAMIFVSTVCLTSYPFWFVYKQANMEICVWVLLSLAIYFFFKGHGYSAAALIGVAGAMKIFPFVYLGLLLARRQYRQCCVALLVAGAVTLSSLWIVYPHIAVSWRLTNLGVAHFRTLIMLHVFPQSSFDHSLFGLMKAAMHPLPASTALNPILSLCLGFSAILGVVLYVVRIRHLPVANQLLCLCVASILLPPTSFDYTLIHLYAPWVLLVLLSIRPENRTRHIPGLTAVLICFAILFVPETEVIRHGYSYGGQLKALVLMILFVLGLVYPFEGIQVSAMPGKSNEMIGRTFDAA